MTECRVSGAPLMSNPGAKWFYASKEQIETYGLSLD